MPEIKKTFLRGRMNKDLDERLIPEGEYTDAQNIQVSSTDESEAGTVQNIKGTTKIFDTIAQFSLELGDFNCVGAIQDDEHDKIYWFIKGTGINTKQAIIEYDLANEIAKPVLIDNTGTILEFLGNSNERYISGIKILDQMIIWTDNITEPKIVDLQIFYNKTTYTQPDWSTTTSTTKEDILVIKKKPSSAPNVKITSYTSDTSNSIFEEKFIRFAYRWKFTNGQYSAYSPFTETVFDPTIDPVLNQIPYNKEEGYNERQKNNIEKIKLEGFEVPNNVEQIEILYKESNNTNVYLYKTIKNPTQSEVVTIENKEESVFSVLPENQLLRQYDNVPVKAKAIEIVANRLMFGNYVEGIDINDYVPNITISTTPRSKLLDFDGGTVNNTDLRTIKSGRKYQFGVVFEDEYGRQTPVITSEAAIKNINYGENALPQAFQVTLNNAPTATRIKKYKYFIKESSDQYYNFIIEHVYDDNDNTEHAWLLVPSYEINKVTEEDTIVLKKAANGGAIASPTKYKILDISESTPNGITSSASHAGKFFIKIKKDSNITTELLSQGGITNSALIDENSSNWEFIQGGPAPSNSLLLGQYSVADGQNTYERTRFYYKDGKIYEVVDETGYPVNNDFQSGVFATYNTNPTCSSLTDNNWADLSITGTGDSSGDVDAVFVQAISGNPDIPGAFYICLSNTPTTSGTGFGPAVFEVEPNDGILDIYYETEDAYDITDLNAKTLRWYNAYQFTDGVESDRIKDDFNEVTLGKGVRVSTQTDAKFKEYTRENGIISSDIYNSKNSVNNLNQFNTGVPITKDISPEYGGIQRLHVRSLQGSDLIVFAENRVLRLPANKDLLYNADGTTNLISTNQILGTAFPYAGDFGISDDPMSFAENGSRIYFVDRAKNAILRLSTDGLTVISSKGMKTFFRDKLNNQTLPIVGVFDEYSNQYILSFDNSDSTIAESITFKEDVDGWVSRLTYVIKPAVSINGKLYSFNYGNLYEHYHPSSTRNVFHEKPFTNSGVQLVFNQTPSAIKNFKTISYEGSQAKNANQAGWSVGSIITDQQQGKIIEFKEKEGKWFANISGVTKDVGIKGVPDVDVQEFSVQGIGNLDSLGVVPTEFECSTAVYSMVTGNVGDPSLSVATVLLGTIKSITPATLQEGQQEYTAIITAPSTGYTNSGDDINCKFTLTLTPQENLTCTTSGFVLSIDDGLEGDPVTGSASINGAPLTIQAINPGVYQPGSGLNYTATILVPAGYLNEGGTIDCDDTATAATGGYDCNTFSDWVTVSYDVSSGNITVLPKRPSTTVHSYTPTGSAPNQGNVPITYTFSDNGAAWTNSGTQIQCIDGITVDTTVTYSATISGPSTFQVNSQTFLSVIVEGDGVYNQDIDVTSQLNDPVDFVWSGPASMSGKTGISTDLFTEQAAGEIYTYYVTIDTTSLTGSSSSIVASKNIEWVDGPTVTLSASANASFTGSNVELTANGQNISNALFEFSESYDDGANWTVVQGFSSYNTFTSTKACGTNPGTITYKVRMDGTNSITNAPLASPVENNQINNKVSVVWNDAPEWNLYFVGSGAILHSICDTDVNTLQQVTLYGDTLTGAPNDPSYTTKLYQNCERTIDNGSIGTYLHIAPDGTKKYAYFNFANIVSQPNSSNGWLTCSNMYLTVVDNAQTIDVTGQTLQKCVNIDTVGITANIEGFNYDEISWTPTGSVSLFTSASSSVVQSVDYICTAINNTTNQTLSASVTIDWVSCSTKVLASKCPSGTQRVLEVDGIASMANAGDVVEFTFVSGNLPEGDGCYTLVQKTGVTESAQAVVSVSNTVGFSDCDSCGCDPNGTSTFNSISASDLVSYIYSDGGGFNNITVSANVTNTVCFSYSNYKWYAGTTTDQAQHVQIKTTGSTNQASINYQELQNAGLSITPGSTLVYYHCKLDYTISGGSTQTATSSNTQAMTWINFPEYTVAYSNTGSALTPDSSICSSSNFVTIYGNVGQSAGQDNFIASTKFYSNAQGSAPPPNGTYRSNFGGGATNVYSYFDNGIPQTPNNPIPDTNYLACPANFSLTSTRGDSPINLCNNLTATLSANYDSNAITLNTSTYEWRVNNIVQTGSNGSSSFTASNPGGTGQVIYGVSVYDTLGMLYEDQFYITWQNCTVKVKARKCPSTSGFYRVFTIENTAAIANGVFELTATVGSLPEGDGCYTIFESGATVTENSEATATASGQSGTLQAYADCNASVCNPVDQYYLLSRCLDGAQYRTSQTTDNINYYVNQILEYNTQSYVVIGTTTDTGITSISSFTTTSYTSCPAYYGLQKCSDQSTNHRSSVDVEQFTLNIGDRVREILSGAYYTVINNTATSGTLATVTSTGLTGCPEPTQNYYQIRECSTGTDYRTQRTTDQVNLFINNIVYNQTGDVFFTVISNTAQVGDFPEYSTQVYQSPYSSCPLGSYNCNTYNDWVTASYNSSTGNITLTPVRNTTTVTTYSPTNAASGQGVITVTYSFRDSDVNWSNTDEIISGCTISVDTGTAIVYRATFTDCDGLGSTINVTSSQQIDTNQVLSDGITCYQFANNNGGSSEQDVTTYTSYGNCTECDNVVNPTTTTTTTTLAPCHPINAYVATDNPATSSAAMNILCGTGAGARTSYFSTTTLSNQTVWYTDFTCSTIRSTHGYLTDATNTAQYYYWNGNSMSLIGSTNCP